MGCLACGRGFHTECLECKTNKCHPVADSSEKESLKGRNREGQKTKVATGLRGRPLKEVEDMIDEKSTGRKRAAHLYPIFKDKLCEWNNKTNCGGGLKPITGCKEGKQQHRHHGPVKDTRRNEQGNVHRICVHCHNRWHTLNDDIYIEEEYNKLPHAPVDTTEDIVLASEMWWKSRHLLKEK